MNDWHRWTNLNNLGFKNIDKQSADDFSFLFQVANASKLGNKHLSNFLVDKRDVVMIFEQCDYFLGFIHPH